MEIGNEISQKIRSAIKAKLVDLGAYDDEELPDYVMVMVANKKSQAQMTEDLGLFLGNNTERFTAWLHSLLKKLQTITADSKDKNITEQSAYVAQAKPSTRENEPLEDYDETVLTLRPETDEFEEEARQEAVTSMQQKTAKVSITPTTPTSSSVVTKKPDISPNKLVPTYIPSPKESHSTSQSVSASTACASRSGSASSNTPMVPRKRRVPGSVVGSVVRAETYQEEEYDPHKPLIGKVASMVRVGKRRPTVPPSLQANKSLVMKAMTEAHDSVERMHKHRPEKSLGRTHTEEFGGLYSASRSQRSMRSRVGRSVSDTSGEVRTITVRHELSPDQTRATRPSERSIQLLSRSKREDTVHRFRADVSGTEEEKPSPKHLEEDYVDLGESADNRLIQCDENKKLEEEEEVKEERKVRIDPAPAAENKDKTDVEELELELETLIESGAEESEFTDTEELDKSTTKTENQMLTERPSSPKFVVTLDGLDPSLLKHKFESPGEMEDEEEGVSRVDNVVRVKPLFSKPVGDDDGPPVKRSRSTERCKFWPSCKNGAECSFQHPTEQCRMFPNCKFGDKCHFIHPNCKFDANCTRAGCPYTHACKNPGQPTVVIQPVRVPVYAVPRVPFISHMRHSTPPHSRAPQETVCKFFPQCTNMNCPYKHPKPCRYGLGCTSKSTCPYSHPSLPSKDQLKWAPSKTRTSSSDT